MTLKISNNGVRDSIVGMAFCILFSTIATAAPISWQPAQYTTGAADLVTGTAVFARNGGSATVSVGGATFSPVDLGNGYLNDVYPAPGITSTGNTGFDTLIQSLTFGGGTNTTITITGLTMGTEYQVQVFYNDQRNSALSRVMTYGDGLGNDIDVAASSPEGGNGEDYGQYAIGTFTAGAATQTLSLATSGFSNAHLNGVLVVEPGPPDAPVVPTNLTAFGGITTVSLSWDGNSQAGFSNFIVKRSSSSGGPYTPIPGATPSVSSYTDTGLVNETSYYYIVTAKNAIEEESAPSNEVEGTPTATPPPAPPNFIFIITDDQDTYSVGAYRNSEPAETEINGSDYAIQTPNIDRLATEGMLFHQARLMGGNTGAVCTASRTCIMSGKTTWERTNGVTAAVTLPGIFNRGVRSGNSALPYATYRTCKNGNSYATANNEFQVLNQSTKRGNTDGSGSEWHADRVLDYIDDWQTNYQPGNKPFLIYFGLSHPHDTRNARETPDLAGRYGSVNTTTPGNLILNTNAPPLPYSHLPVDQSLGIPANFPFHPFDNGHINVRDEISAVGMDTYRTEAVVRNEIGRNFACVDWIDQQVGRMLTKLEDPNGDGNTADSLLDNTYIIFTSDHGIAIGRHGLQGKQNLYEHTWRVPYIVRGPGIAAGSETDALVYLHDTFPTLCDLAGLDIPSTIDTNDGQSFRDVLEGNGEGRNALYGTYAGGDKPGMRAITDGRFKLIKYDVDGDATQVTQMFDLETNSFELLPEHGVPNIATLPAYAAIRQRLEETLTQQRIVNADPYAFLGDRTLLRFEDDTADRLPLGNSGTAASGNGGALPVFSADVPSQTDYVVGESNTASLDFEQDNQNYVQVASNSGLNFGAAPFTIEAWVKLETLPTSDNAASTMPVVMKKVIGSGDTTLDYMFLAAAGSYGDSITYNRLALHIEGSIIISSLSIPDTGWHHISVALDPVSDTLRFTLDDQADTLATTASGTVNAGPLIIGAHFNSSGVIDRSFDGLIDELSITDGFLDLAELQPLAAVASSAPFEIVDFTLTETGSTVALTFESNDTRLYTVQKSLSLEPESWLNVRTFIPGETSASETTISDLTVEAAEPKAFFRVITAN
ncbi:MAG: sulfatase-like hydrolase/transferase [Luteolibacter sp.]